MFVVWIYYYEYQITMKNNFVWKINSKDANLENHKLCCWYFFLAWPEPFSARGMVQLGPLVISTDTKHVTGAANCHLGGDCGGTTRLVRTLASLKLKRWSIQFFCPGGLHAWCGYGGIRKHSLSLLTLTFALSSSLFLFFHALLFTHGAAFWYTTLFWPN